MNNNKLRERAAELTFQICECFEPGDNTHDECKKGDHAYQALLQTREEAIREAAEIVKEFVRAYPSDVFIPPKKGRKFFGQSK